MNTIEKYAEKYPGELHITEFHISDKTKLPVLKKTWILADGGEIILHKIDDYKDEKNDTFTIHDPYEYHLDGIHYFHRKSPTVLLPLPTKSHKNTK